MPNKNQIAGMSLSEIQEFLAEEKGVLPYGYKLPYMMWYEENFVGSSEVREMEPIEEWMYRQLLAKAWVSKNAPYLPNDIEILRRLSGCRDLKLWNKYYPVVLDMFTETEDHRELFHYRQLIDYVVQISKISVNIENGSKGGRAKKANANQSLSQLELEQELELKPNLESEQNEEFGQETMKIKNEIQAVCAHFGVKAGGYKNTWDEIAVLARQHSVGGVVNDFREWMQENSKDDFRTGPVSAYLYLATDRLSVDSTPARVTLKDPAVVSLIRHLTHLSGGTVAFEDKHKIRLAEVLESFSVEEIISVFKTWLDAQDLNNTAFLFNLPHKFVQLADGLCYSLRQTRIEKLKSDSERAAAVLRLQEQAEVERLKTQKKISEEESLFDPLA